MRFDDMVLIATSSPIGPLHGAGFNDGTQAQHEADMLWTIACDMPVDHNEVSCLKCEGTRRVSLGRLVMLDREKVAS